MAVSAVPRYAFSGIHSRHRLFQRLVGHRRRNDMSGLVRRMYLAAPASSQAPRQLQGRVHNLVGVVLS